MVTHFIIENHVWHTPPPFPPSPPSDNPTKRAFVVFNPCHATGLSPSTTLKVSENLWSSDVFKGDRKWSNDQWYEMGIYTKFFNMLLSCYCHFWTINDLSFFFSPVIITTRTASHFSTFILLNQSPGARKKGNYLSL